MKRSYDQSSLATGSGPASGFGPSFGSGSSPMMTTPQQQQRQQQYQPSFPFIPRQTVAHNPNAWYDDSVASKAIKFARNDPKGNPTQAYNYNWPPTTYPNNSQTTQLVQPAQTAPPNLGASFASSTAQAYSQPPPPSNTRTTQPQNNTTPVTGYYSNIWNLFQVLLSTGKIT